MFRIGVLSDTHGFFDPRIATYFRECDEIWH
ncbi:MAG: YfcE family phosphodiesterase, partial [Bacteroidetes bacterium]